ncbi:early-responsive to dehydration stress protein ERD4, partial [Prunus dulcis]
MWAIEVRGSTTGASHSFRASSQSKYRETLRIFGRSLRNLKRIEARRVKRSLCPTFAKCRTRTGLGSNSKVEIGLGPVILCDLFEFQDQIQSIAENS